MSKIPQSERSKRQFIDQFRGPLAGKTFMLIQIRHDGFWQTMFNVWDLKSVITTMPEMRTHSPSAKLRLCIYVTPTEKEDQSS